MNNLHYSSKDNLKPATCEKEEFFRMQENDFWADQRIQDQQESERFID